MGFDLPNLGRSAHSTHPYAHGLTRLQAWKADSLRSVKQLIPVSSMWPIGPLVDLTLSWKPHVYELSKKLARNCGIFYKIRHFVWVKTLRLLYYSLFHSFLSYGVTVWGLTHPSITDPLYKLQKKVIRAICLKDKYDHTTALFRRSTKPPATDHRHEPPTTDYILIKTPTTDHSQK